MNIQAPIKAEAKLWFTAQEFADAADAGIIIGIPASKRGINDLAEREKWQRYRALVKTKKGRGGTITHYHINLLPVDVRVAYLSRFIQADADDLAVSFSSDVNLSERARQERAAKMITVRLAAKYRKGIAGLTAMAADHLFVLTFNAGKVVGLPDWVRDIVGALSVRTLQRWRSKALENDGLTLAHDPAEARKGTGLLETANNGDVAMHILAYVAEFPGLSADVIRDQVEYQFGRELVARNGELKPLPPVRTFQHFIAQLREEQKAVILAYSNPDAYRSRMKLRGTNAYRHVTRPNQMWMIDASPVDALCVDGRWSMYACVDVATRRYIITFSRTPRSEAVLLLLRRAILAWGPPEVVKTDNGSDFVAAATVRLFIDLDIAPDTSKAYSPAEKGIVERAIKTFQHEVAPQLPGYIGHNVTDRKAIESKKSFAQRLGADERELFEVSMTIDELRAWTDDWLTYIYHEGKHAGLKGLTPNEAYARSTEKPRRVDERALDVLLMPVAGQNGIRKMGPRGIQIDYRFYLSGSILVGTDVFCRQDPEDLGKIYVYSADGRQFLDVAIAAEFSGVNPAEFAKAVTAQGNALVAERLKDLKAEVRQIKKGPAAIARSIEVAKRRMADKATAQDNVIQLPKREERYSTPALDAALEAATLPGRTPVPKSLNEKAAELHAAIVREAENRGQSTVVHLDPDAGLSEGARNFKWAQALEAAIATGVKIADDEAVRLVKYQGSTDYQTRKDMLESFGIQAALGF
ncbi:DDE-type integrase/transposase/recombinase [Shinella sp.]|uniref:DDE-type integrase/transposase/recombinase n=1 Tax=Shinella sp. TaxID=1870904 RepID=UPI0039E4C2ED